MSIYTINKILLPLSLSLTLLSGTESSVIGCSSALSQENEGCDSQSILTSTSEKKDIFKIQEKKFPSQYIQTNISKELKSIKVNHKGENVIVIRKITDDQKSCPPYCIVPISIDGVKTVGELETLDFLKTLGEKGDSIVLDTRESKYYNEGTIPGALNLPAHMLQEDSKYFKDVLSILGIKKVNDKWKVDAPHNLLIFDNGLTDDNAYKTIKSLLRLSYPVDNILYYRGGFSTWKDLGLTIY
jgi:rhodanese-related sulfurtransferase